MRHEAECGCVPGHRMLVTTSACADCGLTEIEVLASGRIRPCIRPRNQKEPSSRI